jgi:hypothetical protein
MCMFCRLLFVFLYFFFWPLSCLFFFDIWILITPLVSSNSSHLLEDKWYICWQCVYILLLWIQFLFYSMAAVCVCIRCYQCIYSLCDKSNNILSMTFDKVDTMVYQPRRSDNDWGQRQRWLSLFWLINIMSTDIKVQIVVVFSLMTVCIYFVTMDTVFVLFYGSSMCVYKMLPVYLFIMWQIQHCK